MRVIRHGVDLELFRPSVDREQVRRRFGLDAPTMISVGHLIERKGHDIAIRSLDYLPGHQLLIVGEGPKERELRRLASGLHLGDRVKFLGLVPQPELPPLLCAADVLVNCSDREGIANVLLEAMACGTPVVATHIWGSSEVISSPEAGILVHERSPAAVAQGVRRLLAQRPDGVLTRSHAQRFSWIETARQHLETIEDLLLSGGSAKTAATEDLGNCRGICGPDSSTSRNRRVNSDL